MRIFKLFSFAGIAWLMVMLCAGNIAAQRLLETPPAPYVSLPPLPTPAPTPTPLPPPPALPDDRSFQLRHKEKKFTMEDGLREFEAPVETDYRLGAGDEITIETWGRPELTGHHTLGPDGKITLPLAGHLVLRGETRDEAAAAIQTALSRYYQNLAVNVRVDNYVSNRIFILGRVSSPGMLRFETQPTLLEAVTRAGGLPIGGVGAEKAALTRLAIFRGRDQVVWIEFKKLLTEAQLGLNIRLQRDDIIYIPDSDDQLIYVMGEVNKPGAYRLTPDMTFMDALGLAAGPTKDADSKHLHLIRPSINQRREFALADITRPLPNQNVSLVEGDIIYVQRRNLARFSYFIEKVSPFATFLFFGKALAK